MRCRFEKKRQGLNQIRPSVFNRLPLAGNVQFRRERHESIVLAFDNCGDVPGFTHSFSLRQTWRTHSCVPRRNSRRSWKISNNSRC